MVTVTWITVVILQLIHGQSGRDQDAAPAGATGVERPDEAAESCT